MSAEKGEVYRLVPVGEDTEQRSVGWAEEFVSNFSDADKQRVRDMIKVIETSPDRIEVAADGSVTWIDGAIKTPGSFLTQLAKSYLAGEARAMEQFDFPKFADLLDKEGRPAKKRQKWKMF
jgi:hypothetical protein